MDAFELWLVDVDPKLVEEWHRAFSATPSSVFIREGNILELAEDTLVSPANSYGWMDGGIDRLYLEHFGASFRRECRTQ